MVHAKEQITVLLIQPLLVEDPELNREIHIISCTPAEAGDKILRIRDNASGEVIGGGTWTVTVTPTQSNEVDKKLRGTWRANDSLSLPNGLGASFDFRIEVFR